MQQELLVSPDQVVVRNILLATDFSQYSARALNYALGVASRYKSQLHLFHCIDPAPYRLADPDVVWKTHDDIRGDLERRVEELRGRGRAKDIEIKVAVEVGEVGEILPQTVKDIDADLIVIGTHGRTGWEKLVLGSVAEKVMDVVSCPVLTVGPSANRTRIEEFGPENILLVSGTHAHSQRAESYAFSLTRKYGSRLTVVDVLENRSGRVVAQVSELKFGESHLGNNPRDRLVPGNLQLPSEIGTETDLILKEAGRSSADLIVLPVPANHRFTDRFVSNSSYRLVCGALCPVLSVRAE